MFFNDSSKYAIDFAIDPQNHNKLYMAYDRGVIRSADGGDTWTDGSAGIKAFNTYSIAIYPQNPSIMVAAIRSIGVFKSTDGGKNWVLLWSERAAQSISQLEFNPKNPQIIYALDYFDAIWRSDDGGQNWAHADDGIEGSIWSFAIDHKNPSTLYAGTHNKGLYRSTDSGQHWMKVYEWTPAVRITSIAVDPQNSSTIYIGTNEYDNPAGSAKVFKSTRPDFLEFDWKKDGLEAHRDMRVYEILIHPKNTQLVYLATDEGLFKSDNGGDYWTNAMPLAATMDVVTAVLDPKDTSKIYAGDWYLGLYKSVDGGAAWSKFNAGIPTKAIICLAINPQTPGILFAGTMGYGIYRSLSKAYLPVVSK